MLDFDFYNPTRILFGKDRLGEIDTYVPADAAVLITYGGGSAKKSGLIDKVKNVLTGRKVYEFGGIEPNPRYETLVKALEIVRRDVNFQQKRIQIWLKQFAFFGSENLASVDVELTPEDMSRTTREASKIPLQGDRANGREHFD